LFERIIEQFRTNLYWPLSPPPTFGGGARRT